MLFDKNGFALWFLVWLGVCAAPVGEPEIIERDRYLPSYILDRIKGIPGVTPPEPFLS
jgi:hypothetical protein